MHDLLVIDAKLVTAQIERLKRIFPDMVEDADLLASTVEGETNFDRVLERVTEAFLDAVAMKDAVASRMSALKERADRFDRKAEAMKELAHGLLKAADRRNAVLPIATLSIAKGRNRLVIDDIDAIPQGFAKFEKVAIKADIAAALAAGDQIPGARLEPTPDHLSVRTK